MDQEVGEEMDKEVDMDGVGGSASCIPTHGQLEAAWRRLLGSSRSKQLSPRRTGAGAGR